MKNKYTKHAFKIRAVVDKDREEVRKFISEHWGAEKIITRGKVHYPHKLSGFIAFKNKKILGLITYRIEKNECELITLDTITKKKGIGTALVEKVKRVTKRLGCKRLWGITTNDNINALRFWQKRGFILTAVYPNAISLSRKLKPEIPLIGNYGIPIRDEIEIEFKLKK